MEIGIFGIDYWIMNQMNRQMRHLNTVRTINVPSLFRNESKSSLCTPKTIPKFPGTTKSKSKSLRRQFPHHSSSKSLLEFHKRQTPTNSYNNKLTPKSSRNPFKKQEGNKGNKEKKVILLKNNSVKNLSTAHSKSTISLKNRSIQSSIKSKASDSQHVAPNSSRTSTFKEEADDTLFLNRSEIESDKPKQKGFLKNPMLESSETLNEEFLKKRADVYRIFQHLDGKFNQIKVFQECPRPHESIRCPSLFSKKGIVDRMQELSIGGTEDLMGIVSNKLVTPLCADPCDKQNLGLLFDSHKINKVYVSSYKKRNR